MENVLVASRRIDSTHEAHAAIPITPQAMTTGQRAGTAAALRERPRSQGAFV